MASAAASSSSNNCVVYTYYSDVSAVINEHFSKALGNSSQSGQFAGGGEKTKDVSIPMSQRNLPPSFWRQMNHQQHDQSQQQQQQQQQQQHSQQLSALEGATTLPPSTAASSSFFIPPPTLSGSQPPPSTTGHELYSPATDPYHPSARYPMHQNDPWHYSLSGAATNPYSAHHHRSATSTSMHHDHHLGGYTSASNRFNAQYSSLLLQPSSMRSSRLAPVSGACGAFEKAAGPHDMSWLGAASRYHHDAINFATGHHPIDPNYTASAAYGAAMSAAMSAPEQSSYAYADLYKMQATTTNCMPRPVGLYLGH